MPQPGTERRERPAGQPDHLARTDDSARVVRVDLRRRGRVGRLQLRVRGRDPSGLRGPRLELGPQREVLAGERQVVDDGLHVEAGSADEERTAAARLDVRDRGARRSLGAGDRPVLPRIGDVDEMVRHRGALLGRRLRGTDVHAPVHLHRVDRDDLDVTEGARDRQRERGLPRCGRTDEGEVGDAQAQPAATGIRVRARRGGTVTSTSSPRNQCGAASTMRTPAYAPAAGADALPWAVKCTSLFWPVRPDSNDGSFFDGPSTSTSSTRLTRAWCLASAWCSTTSTRRRIRSAATSGATNWLVISAATVPGRGENTNVYAES